MEQNKQLKKGELINLHEEYRSGIRRILFWIAETDLAFITVDDDQGPSFAIDIPKKEDMPEGHTPMWYWNHCMLFGPETNTQRKLYA